MLYIPDVQWYFDFSFRLYSILYLNNANFTDFSQELLEKGFEYDKNLGLIKFIDESPLKFTSARSYCKSIHLQTDLVIIDLRLGHQDIKNCLERIGKDKIAGRWNH